MTTTTTQPTTMLAQPTVEQVLAGMAAQVGGHLPPWSSWPRLSCPRWCSSMPRTAYSPCPRKEAHCPEETRTLMLLGIALATGSHCVEGLMNKAKVLNMEQAKILETVKIARFAEATRVFNNAEHVLAQLDAGQ